jgi:hypothetical protein
MTSSKFKYSVEEQTRKPVKIETYLLLIYRRLDYIINKSIESLSSSSHTLTKRGIFGPKGDWRKLNNEELYNLYFSPNIIRMIKSRRMKWAGHVARRGRRGMHIGY